MNKQLNRDKPASTSPGSATKSLEEFDNLPDPDVLAREIVEHLEAALEQFREIAVDLSVDVFTEKDRNGR